MVTASREWVCVRPATYESAIEAEVLQSYYMGRQGTLENTVFALLDSNAKLLSKRAGRSPGMLYDGPAQLAAALIEHGAGAKKSDKRALPRIDNLRLAMNIAACDSIPLIVAFASEAKAREQITVSLAQSAWAEGVAGNAHFVICKPEELDAFESLASKRTSADRGILVLDPDNYGRSAEVLATLKVKSTATVMTKSLRTAISKHEAIARDHREHVREGKRQGLEWEGQIEGTDSRKSRR
ncbi:MAG: hypothetical protein ACI8X5_002373 [Planctomycetota bacterium]